MAFSLAYIKSYYKMPFLHRGMKVIANGKTGIVTSGDGAYIRVRCDDVKSSRRFRPQWETVYFDKDGKIIADYRNNGGQ
jgi:hypothetical protein